MSLSEKKLLHTPFGKARLDKGYYVIKTSKEGNHNQPLHRLIYENFYGFKIPDGFIIHHKNGNKLDNCILNLQLLNNKEHRHIHGSGENNPFYGKTHSEETKNKMRYAKEGIHMEKEIATQISHTMNTSGFYRVSTKPCKNCKLGFSWCYQYYDEFNKKSISSVDLLKLKEKVIAKELDWKIIDAHNAQLICNEFNYDLKELT